VKVALFPGDGPTGAYFDLNGEASFVWWYFYFRLQNKRKSYKTVSANKYYSSTCVLKLAP
jgi:hypothetical protein